MSSDLSLNRRSPTRPLISLVPMIDVMLILLVFFMVTSTYLNLDMIPALSQSEQQSPPAQNAASGQSAATVLVRVGADDVAYVQGRPLQPEDLSALLAERLAANAATQVIILPTGSARLQALVSVMDTVTGTGVTNMRVVRLEARP